MSRRPFIAAISVVLIVALGQGQAQAQVTPFKITGGGLVPDGLSLIPGVPAYHNATGVATKLGAYSGEGWFTLLDFTSPLTAEFSSAPDFVFTAANGDELAMTYGVVGNGAKQPGEVTLYPVGDECFIAVFVAEFNPVPAKSTGRFAKVTGGSFIMIAISDPFFLLATETTPFAYFWKGDGTLTFRKGK